MNGKYAENKGCLHGKSIPPFRQEFKGLDKKRTCFYEDSCHLLTLSNINACFFNLLSHLYIVRPIFQLLSYFQEFIWGILPLSGAIPPLNKCDFT